MSNIYFFGFSEYFSASHRRRIAIQNASLTDPRVFIVATSARAIIRQYFLNHQDDATLFKGLGRLQAATPISDHGLKNKKKSLEVLNEFINMNKAEMFNHGNLSQIKRRKHPFYIHDLKIDLSPDLEFQVTQPDGVHIGAICLRTTKEGTFSEENCKVAALLLEKYMKQKHAQSIGKVDKDLCFCIDPYNNCWASSPHDEATYNAIIEETYAMITSQNKSAA